MNGNLTSKLNNEAYVPIRSANRAPLIGKAYSVKYTSVIKFELDVSVITLLYADGSLTPFVVPL